MINTIAIEGIKVYGYHGCLEEEAKIGGNYVVDVYMQTDFSRASETDQLTDTIDYCSVYEICKAEMKVRSKLIEQVCQRIHSHLRKAHTNISHLTVRLTKLTPPMNGDVEKVSVEIRD